MATFERQRGKLDHNPALDGLRALAALGICAYHAGFSWASGGFLSVSAFFTLSGFLITRLLLAEHAATGTLAIGAFWGRRFRRLLPPALISLALIVVITLLGLGFELTPSFSGDIISALLYVTNWRFVLEGYDYAAIFSAPSPVQHFWSLGIEEQFYLLFPALVLGLLRFGRGSRRALSIGIGFATLASALWMAWLYTQGGSMLRVYFGADTRMAEIGVGALLALAFPTDSTLEKRRGVAWLGVLALALMGVLFVVTQLGDAWVYRGGLFVHALLTAIVLAGLCVPGPLHAALASPPLQFMGRISYGIYVYHWPVFLLLDAEVSGLAPAPLFATRMLIVMVLATLSHRYVEAPIRAGTRLPGRVGVVIATATVGLIGVTVVGADRTRESAVDAMEAEETPGANFLGEDDLPLVFVVGDSLARNTGFGLKYWAKQTGRARVLTRARPGCAVALGGTRRLNYGDVRDTENCNARHEEWYDISARFRPDYVVMLTGGLDLVDRRLDEWADFAGPGDPHFDAWLLGTYREVVDRFAADGAQVIWLTWPCAKDKAYGGAHTGSDTFSIERVRHLNEVIVPALAASRSDVVRVIDVFAHVCPDGRFTQALGDFEDARPDGVHFSLRDARWLAEWLGPQVIAGATGETGAQP